MVGRQCPTAVCYPWQAAVPLPDMLCICCSTVKQILMRVPGSTYPYCTAAAYCLCVLPKLQGCFLPGGALPVELKSTDHLITQINTLRVAGRFDTVVFTQDYHPPNHVSFAAVHDKQPAETVQLQNTSHAQICGFEHLYPEASAQCSNNSSCRDNAPRAAVATHTVQQMMWPVHCVQNTQEAALHPGLLVHSDDFLVRKGWQPQKYVYSAFLDSCEVQSTGLASLLHKRGISSVTIVGVALDYCVLWIALDSVKLGFITRVVLDATAFVSAAGARTAKQRLQDAGVQLQQSIWDAVSESFVAAS